MSNETERKKEKTCKTRDARRFFRISTDEIAQIFHNFPVGIGISCARRALPNEISNRLGHVVLNRRSWKEHSHSFSSLLLEWANRFPFSTRPSTVESADSTVRRGNASRCRPLPNTPSICREGKRKVFDCFFSTDLRVKISKSCWILNASSWTFCFSPFSWACEVMFEWTRLHSSMIWSTEWSLKERKTEEFCLNWNKECVRWSFDSQPREIQWCVFFFELHKTFASNGKIRDAKGNVSRTSFFSGLFASIRLTRWKRSTADCTDVVSHNRS